MGTPRTTKGWLDKFEGLIARSHVHGDTDFRGGMVKLMIRYGNTNMLLTQMGLALIEDGNVDGGMFFLDTAKRYDEFRNAKLLEEVGVE